MVSCLLTHLTSFIVSVQELVNRVRVLLQQGAEVDGSPPAQELEWLILQRRNVRVQPVQESHTQMGRVVPQTRARSG